MIYGPLDIPESHNFLLGNEGWRVAFEWLKRLPPDMPGGIHPILDGDRMYANVHGYKTLARCDCKFESHRRYVDLQYCITGGETIDWERTSSLKATGPYDAEKDLLFYEAPDEASLTTVHLVPGTFAIFFPDDAHRPKQADCRTDRVWKLVIKVSRDLLA